MRGLANKEVRDTPAPESVRCDLRAAFWSITSNVVGNPVSALRRSTERIVLSNDPEQAAQISRDDDAMDDLQGTCSRSWWIGNGNTEPQPPST